MSCHEPALLTNVESPSLVLVTPTACQRLSSPLTQLQHPRLSRLLRCAEAALHTCMNLLAHACLNMESAPTLKFGHGHSRSTNIYNPLSLSIQD